MAIIVNVAVNEDGDHVDRVIDAWRQEWPELDASSTAVVGRINRLAAALQVELDAAIGEFGISRASFGILATLRRSGPPYRLPQGAFGDALLRTSGTVSVRIDQLERAGLVRREPDPVDRRGLFVAMTDEGRALVDQIAPAHLANQETLLAPLDRSERDQLAALLRKLLLGFERIESTEPLGLSLASAHVARRMRRAVGLPDASGLLVRAVEPSSPAAIAGIVSGDMIVAVEGLPVRTGRDLERAVARQRHVDLTVIRGVQERTIALTFRPGDS